MTSTFKQPLVDVHDAKDEGHHDRQLSNQVQSLVICGAIGSLLVVCAYQLWSWPGVPFVLTFVAVISYFGPRMPPEAVMRLYRAQPLDRDHGAQIYRVTEVLAGRAGLKAIPSIYIVPSLTLNAFATGKQDRPAIALTEGILRKLSLRELTGVIAHELSHVRNNDLWIMGLADTMTKLTQIMYYGAFVLLAVHIPALFTASARVPWLAIILLFLAPTISSLLQLALSRTREYEADLDGVRLTGDPTGYANALNNLERYQGSAWEDLALPGRRIPQPSLLRSHPDTPERVRRVLELNDRQSHPPINIREEPMVSLVGLGPMSMRPRYRWTGFWY